MLKKCLIVLLPLVIGGAVVAPASQSCSTFMLSHDDYLLVGHNLDQEFYTPGMIHVNRRGELKRSVSGFDLQLSDVETPLHTWAARYGSVTFSPLGRNLPDGGMNEVGLTVNEMGLGDSLFPFNDSLPTMLIHLWIQYQLDNFGTVAEVLSHLGDFNIEPSSTFSPPASANYHFFVTDSAGRFAIIEFLKNGPQIYTDESAPIPVLCNSRYQQELESLARYRGMVGWFRRQFDSGKDLRCVNGAMALEDFELADDTHPFEYCLDLLAEMQFTGTKQWSVVYDVREKHVYFRTSRAPGTRHFTLDSLDFSPDASPAVLEDIDIQFSGDVTSSFADFTPDADRATVGKFLRSLVSFVADTEDTDMMDKHMLENYGFDVQGYTDRAIALTELIRRGRE